MEIKEAFSILLQVREKFVGTKQEQIAVDKALQTISEQLFPKAVEETIKKEEPTKPVK